MSEWSFEVQVGDISAHSDRPQFSKLHAPRAIEVQAMYRALSKTTEVGNDTALDFSLNLQLKKDTGLDRIASQRSIIQCIFRMILNPSEQLQPSRHQFLKDTIRIILFRDALQPLLVGLTVRSKDILTFVGVVQICDCSASVS